MYFYCSKCKKNYPINTMSYKCECGGLFKLFKDPSEILHHSVSLGEVETPLLKMKINKLNLFLKLEQFHATGSFKDRGAFMMINQLKNVGIHEIVEDSSGNAGAAMAAYAAAAGIKASIYVPESTSSGKIKQIKAYGAAIIKVDGARDKTAAAVLEAAKTSYYASHVYNPLFFEGTKSLAYEIYHQLHEQVPNYIFVPVGNGTMLLGLYYGFEEIGRLPKLIAVQSDRCKPLYQKFHNLPENEITPTIAQGIAVGRPQRLDEILLAVKYSQGDVITVADESILYAQDILARQGMYVEMTSAVAVAGALQFFENGKPDNYQVIVPLTGMGMQ
jgi:threonine synthase